MDLTPDARGWDELGVETVQTGVEGEVGGYRDHGGGVGRWEMDRWPDGWTRLSAAAKSLSLRCCPRILSRVPAVPQLPGFQVSRDIDRHRNVPAPAATQPPPPALPVALAWGPGASMTSSPVAHECAHVCVCGVCTPVLYNSGTLVGPS